MNYSAELHIMQQGPYGATKVSPVLDFSDWKGKKIDI